MTAASDAMVRRATFAFCGDPPQVIGGTPYMMDRSANGLHATLVNFAAPNYGFARNAKGQGFYAFNGTTMRATLPLSFYNSASTGALSFIVMARYADEATNDRLFTCRNAGATRGVSTQVYDVLGRFVIQGWDAGGVIMQASETNNSAFYGRTIVSVGVLDAARSYGAWWRDTSATATTFAGSTNAIAYDTAVVPTIGAFTGGGAEPQIDLYHISMWPWALSRSDAVDITRMILDGVL